MTEIAPMTPPECDLRGLPFMPLDVVRLVDSNLFALTTGDEFKAAVTLWCKAWLQVPAASLPDDDRVLAHLSGTGARWKKCKEMALHGFELCSDGRWYHPVVAEKAREAWKHRLSQRERAAKRWAKPSDTPGNADTPSPGNADTPTDGIAVADATASPTAHATAHATACPTVMQGTGRGTVPPDKSGGAPKTGFRLPTGFTVPPDWRAWAATDRGWSTAEITDEAASFADYWLAKSGKDATKLDWEATWRNWCRRSHRKPGGPAGGSGNHIPGGGTPLASPC